MKKNIHHLVILGSMGTAAIAAPFLSIGDNAELFTTANAIVAYNDNVLLAPSGAELSDTVFTLIPGLDLRYGKESEVKGNVFLNSTLSNYIDNDSLNNQLLGTGATAAFDNGKAKIAANASYNERDQATVDNASSNGTLLEHHDTVAGISAELGHSNKISFGAGLNYGAIEYVDSTQVDSTDYSVPVNVYYELTPKVDLSTGVTYTKTELSGPLGGGFSSEYESYYYNVGSRGVFTPKLSGSFSVGYNTRSGNGTVDADQSSMGAKAALSYAYSEKTQLTLGLDRDFANATANGQSYENTSFTLGASSNITVDWRLNAGLTYRTLEYTAFSNTYIESTIGATYTLNEHISLGANYVNRQKGADNGAANEFSNNVVSLSLNARY